MNYKPLILSVTGGLLCALAWVNSSTSLIILVSFVPFFFIFGACAEKKTPPGIVFLRVLPGFIIFNLLTISWLRNASIAGAVYAIIANGFLMSAVFGLSAMICKRSSLFLGHISLLTFWIIMEYINTKINIFTPWLNLGNTLGNNVMLIQWYDLTGVAGGTLWILLCNLSLFYLLRLLLRKEKKYHIPLIRLLLILIVPACISLEKYFRPVIHENEAKILIVQPDIDPYKEKFNGIPFSVQLKEMLKLAENNLTDDTDWVILPETAIDDPFYESNILTNKYYLMIDSLLPNREGISLITGATTMKIFHETDKDLPPSAFRIDSSRIFSEIYNSAVHISSGSKVNFYHKSKLVPGIEQKVRILPSFITERIIPDLGGTMTGYGTQDQRTVFIHPDKISKAAPVICYESVYGEFITGYVRNGSNFIVIITNDGWWDKTAGYRQHLMFARIRAVENRRDVARAANTGISCFIDSKGNICEATEWKEKTVLHNNVSLNDKISFYAANGDFISRYSVVFGIFIIIITFIAAPIRKLRDPHGF